MTISGIRAMTTEEAAKFCGVSGRILRRWCDSGKLESYRVPFSRHRRIQRHILTKFMVKHGIPLDVADAKSVTGILVVGVSDATAEAMRAQLHAARGYSVSFASDAFKVGIAVAESPPGCVIIDLSVGRIDACQIARNLRNSNPDHAALTIIGLSPHIADYSLAAYGFTNVYSKPFDAEEFAVWLDGIFGRMLFQRKDRA